MYAGDVWRNIKSRLKAQVISPKPAPQPEPPKAEEIAAVLEAHEQSKQKPEPPLENTQRGKELLAVLKKPENENWFVISPFCNSVTPVPQGRPKSVKSILKSLKILSTVPTNRFRR